MFSFTKETRTKSDIRVLRAKPCCLISSFVRPALEDASNIMRVISLKNYCESTRVVIQLLQYQNKVGEGGGEREQDDGMLKIAFVLVNKR